MSLPWDTSQRAYREQRHSEVPDSEEERDGARAQLQAESRSRNATRSQQSPRGTRRRRRQRSRAESGSRTAARPEQSPRGTRRSRAEISPLQTHGSIEVEIRPMSAEARAQYRANSPVPIKDDDAVLTIDAKGTLRVRDTPNEMSACLDRFVRQGPQMTRRTLDWLTSNRQAITGLSEVKTLLPRIPLGHDWTVKEKEMVEKDWKRTLGRTRPIKAAKHKELLTLYKACLRLMRCLPQDIIGCRHNLEYDMDQNRAMAKGQSRFWSGPFCRVLTSLLVHPMWHGAITALAAAIQYTVIVETDDDRHLGVDITESESDRFLSKLYRRLRRQPDTKIADLRQQLEEDLSEPQRDRFGLEIRSMTETSHWNLLFRAIEAQVRASSDRSQRPSGSSQDRSGPFLVHRRHLDILHRALDSLTHMGFPMFHTVDMYDRAIAGRRSPRNYPQLEDLRELYEYGLLCELERYAFVEKQKRAAADSSEAEGLEAQESVEAMDQEESEGVLEPQLDDGPSTEPEPESEPEPVYVPESESEHELEEDVHENDMQPSDERSPDEPAVPDTQEGTGERKRQVETSTRRSLTQVSSPERLSKRQRIEVLTMTQVSSPERLSKQQRIEALTMTQVSSPERASKRQRVSVPSTSHSASDSIAPGHLHLNIRQSHLNIRQSSMASGDGATGDGAGTGDSQLSGPLLPRMRLPSLSISDESPGADADPVDIADRDDAAGGESQMREVAGFTVVRIGDVNVIPSSMLQRLDASFGPPEGLVHLPRPLQFRGRWPNQNKG
ncbi:uncharacterized protein P884DRAFT_332299 [Thermothelomyces heterothallicus CBS 202.75]|uniref:uncharacterized protein n=1 Tax=Thermothelomyces heterothallicus CBS 202.75 TaxID=1149848 RepID=UPI00374234B6